MECRDATVAQPVSSAQKPRTYYAPVLTAYGSVAKLTQGGTASAVDGGNTMMIVPPGQDMTM